MSSDYNQKLANLQLLIKLAKKTQPKNYGKKSPTKSVRICRKIREIRSYLGKVAHTNILTSLRHLSMLKEQFWKYESNKKWIHILFFTWHFYLSHEFLFNEIFFLNLTYNGIWNRPEVRRPPSLVWHSGHLVICMSDSFSWKKFMFVILCPFHFL